ncbi:hypothetical protein [Streptomyces sioyaensis]|uniref:hypothetical protein n=1 Tax=Streptomyces sioyaensis TaxID=67364 RepID=UPI0037A08589
MAESSGRDQKTIDALQEGLRSNQHFSDRLRALHEKHEAFRRTDSPQLSQEQMEERVAFRAKARAKVEARAEEFRRDTILSDGVPVASTRFRPNSVGYTFGPDVDGTGGPDVYSYAWSFVPHAAGYTDTARADLRTGDFSATRYITSGHNNSFASLAARMTPGSDWQMTVSPFVTWSGYSKVQTKSFDPHIEEHQPAVSSAFLAISVGAENSSGHTNIEAQKWITLWEVGGLNPNEAHSLSGTAHGGDFVLQFSARANVRYSITVLCDVHVLGTQGFAVETLADSELSCNMPRLQLFA